MYIIVDIDQFNVVTQLLYGEGIQRFKRISLPTTNFINTLIHCHMPKEFFNMIQMESINFTFLSCTQYGYYNKFKNHYECNWKNFRNLKAVYNIDSQFVFTMYDPIILKNIQF